MTKYPQKGRGQGPGPKILNFKPTSISGIGEARNVEFGTWINLVKSYLTHDKIPANGRGQVQGPIFF